MKKIFLLLILVLGVLWMVANVKPALTAYSSHQNDEDVIKFLGAYPFARSTRLDDCSLCHPGGKFGTKYYGSCDYCHTSYGLQPPHGQVPLNAYGQAYKDAGRSQDALKTIETQDSDADTYNNLQEIQALFFPGNSLDHPGLTPAPALVLNLERILGFNDHNQFFLNNASKSADWYARYRGVKVSDLLRYVRIPHEATQITVFAPDGFSKTFPIDATDPQTPPNIQYDVMGPYPKGYYYGTLDFVEYSFHPGLDEDGQIIPDRLYMLLGYLRDGDPLTKGRLVPDPANPGRLVLEGEGPYRLLVPQKVAGGPDRPSTATSVGDGWDYNSNKDHNAGSSVRSVTSIRVEPLPPGTTDFNWTEGGWNLVDQTKLVIYGAINPHTYQVIGKISDSSGHPIADVQISFGFVSLGKAGETISGVNGKFRKELPIGEYIVIPSKTGYTFDPESIPISLSKETFRINFTAYPAP
jgi:hypothetical protein